MFFKNLLRQTYLHTLITRFRGNIPVSTVKALIDVVEDTGEKSIFKAVSNDDQTLLGACCHAVCTEAAVHKTRGGHPSPLQVIARNKGVRNKHERRKYDDDTNSALLALFAGDADVNQSLLWGTSDLTGTMISARAARFCS